MALLAASDSLFTSSFRCCVHNLAISCFDAVDRNVVIASALVAMYTVNANIAMGIMVASGRMPTGAGFFISDAKKMLEEGLNYDFCDTERIIHFAAIKSTILPYGDISA